MRAKRSAFAEFQISELPELDEKALESGEVREIRRPGILGFSALTAAHHRLTDTDIRLLAGLPADHWTEVAAEDLDQVEELAKHGFLILDSDDELHRVLRARDAAFTEGAWSPEAACFHFATEDRYIYDNPAAGGDYLQAVANSNASFTAHAELHGPPPPAFWQPEEMVRQLSLPPVHPQGQLFDVLKVRRSVRTYADRPLGHEQLATLLHIVFGCQGTTELSPGIPVQRKTSPSGGSMHPTEAYPLIRDVGGVESGLYHYSSEHHALNLLEPMEPDEVARLAVECGHGQLYLQDAPLVVLLTSRFTRHLWKYRAVSRAYTVMLMDAAHLSQSWYLVATQLGLGTCFTAALDAPTIEQLLKLDGITQGPVGILACGYPAEGVEELFPLTPHAA